MFVLRIYGELTDEQEEALQRHVRACLSCAAAFAQIEAFQGVLKPEDDFAQPDWEASWRTIKERSLGKPGRRFVLFPVKRFAMIAATAVAVFIIGVLAGRSLFAPDREPVPVAEEHTYRSVASIAAYTEILGPVLIDFLNRGGRPVSEEMAELTERVVTDMLAETRLLKRAAERGGDQGLYELLEDIELILISIANLRGANGDIAAQLDRVIREKSIMHRLKHLPGSDPAI
jgi:hypothetical protein